MFVTGNMRAWHEVIEKRHHVAADRDAQALAAELLKHLRAFAPTPPPTSPKSPSATTPTASAVNRESYAPSPNKLAVIVATILSRLLFMLVGVVFVAAVVAVGKLLTSLFMSL